MPDWRALVLQRLMDLNLPDGQREGIVEELATHLEDVYNSQIARGTPGPIALEHTLALVTDWKQLSLEIRAAKNEEGFVNYRTKSFWLPGLINLTASMLWLRILLIFHWPMQPAVLHSGPPLTPYLIWLVTLPLFGALGAYISRRAGGDQRARIAASLFPAIAMLGLMVAVALFAIFIERNPFVFQHPVLLCAIVLPWVIFPGAALLLGVLPFFCPPAAVFHLTDAHRKKL